MDPTNPMGVADMILQRDLTYTQAGDLALKLDLMMPEAQHPPLILWIHGGGWMALDKGWCPMRGWVDKGYAVASVDYRLSQQAVFPAQIADCKAALAFLVAHADRFGYDPGRIAVAGDSAGGHLAALMGCTDRGGPFGGPEGVIRAVVDLFGPTDLAHMGGSHDAPDSPESAVLGAPVKSPEGQAAGRAADPVTYITDQVPPFLILHGDRDDVVDIRQSQRLFTALIQHGACAQFVSVPGAGHGFPCSLVEGTIDAFLERYLG
jgi:acetyl esterase/lipase